jgi:hypothetical protein
MRPAVLDAACLLAIAVGGRAPYARDFDQALRDEGQRHAVPDGGVDAGLAGRWRSADGAVELRIEPDGSYRRRVAGRARTAHGTCHGAGSALLLCDETGLRTPVTYLGDVLQMAGHELYRG